MKLDINEDVCLVQIVSDEFSDNHMIYGIGPDGCVWQHFKIKDATVDEVIDLVPHMRIIQFSNKEMWQVQCACMFNRIFEPDIVPYDCVEAWDLPPELNIILIHFCDLKHIQGYNGSEDYSEAERTMEYWVNNRPTPIEVKSEKIHLQGVESRKKFLNLIKSFVR